ncbi:uncharacterized protein LOC129791513 [Lutzomyia longipalpis]|uniref:uncharacterized protein LOC129791513 n=1 Tax=Lutzomyia longipalpis TaxID=7200 RepID=UPI0024843D28|nr:uncharacterized protein LOC129791513 [Lutzomyia longipalpis]
MSASPAAISESKSSRCPESKLLGAANRAVASPVDEEKGYFSLSYVPGVSDKLRKKISGTTGLKIAFRPVSKIPCRDCPAKYIGQSKQLLKNRISQHARDSAPPTAREKSALSAHAADTGHSFDFDATRILDTERIYSRRLLLEMLHIKQCPEAVNFRSDVRGLSTTYAGLLK